MGAYLVLLALLVFYLLVQLFTGKQVFDPNDDNVLESVEVVWLWWDLTLTPEGWLLLIVILAGALGSYVHTATSYADYVGNRELRRSWIWWLLLRAPISMALALVFYLLLRGGLLTGVDTQTVEVLNPYGFAAISALVGMFTKQATDKLREIFDNLFRTEEKVERGDKLKEPPDNPSPRITKANPPALKINAPDRKVTLEGSGFIAQSKVKVGDQERETQFESASRLTFTVTDADIASARTLQVTVVNPAPGGGGSPPHELPVTV
jgi:hypothetical protein